MTRWGWRVARASRRAWTAALIIGLIRYGLPAYALPALACTGGIAASLALEHWWRRIRL